MPFGKVWNVVSWTWRIVLVRVRFIALMVGVALLVAYWDTLAAYWDRYTRPAVTPDTVGEEDVEFYCPMHPNVVRAEMGNCPICGMPLSKRQRGEAEVLPEGVVARVKLTPDRVRLAGVGTVAVERRPLDRTIDTVGFIREDERRLARISARVMGRIEELHVDFTGTKVARGDPLLSFYSPDLNVSVQALRVARASGGAPYEASRQRLLRWGLTREQVDEMARGTEAVTTIEVRSPISGTVIEKSVVAGDYVDEGDRMYTIADLSLVWMSARVYERDMAAIHTGARVEIVSIAWPGRTFEGFVSFIDPVLDAATRTFGVRVDVPNAEERLKPGMYVRATLRAPIGADGTVAHPPNEIVYRCCAACPTVERREPGACPQCGMALTPVERPVGRGAEGSEPWVCTCTTHPPYRSPTPGLCPTCDMPLVREGEAAAPNAGTEPAPAPATRTEYYCPMHTEVVQDHPGVCEPCNGMPLLRREVPVERDGEQTAAPEAPEEAERPGAAPATRTEYYCPMHTNVLQDHPGVCEPCGGMTLLAREVRVAAPTDPLAVPVDAVIDTGERQIVYKEVAEGVYDAVQVTLGSRVGGFYPLISGLAEGDRIVVAGAFLVDAEARLSPGAGASYFGASGGTAPSGAGSGGSGGGAHAGHGGGGSQ